MHGAYCPKKDLDRQGIARLCGFGSQQSVDYHIKKLLERNWIGQDDKNYYFRPVKYLCQQYDISNAARGYAIDLEKELEDIQAVLFFMSVKRVIAFRRYVESNNGDYQQADVNGYTLQTFKANTLSVRLLSKLIGISKNMVHRLKHYAKDLDYLKIRHNSRPVLDYERTYLFDNYYDYLFTQDNIVKVRLTDTITPFC